MRESVRKTARFRKAYKVDEKLLSAIDERVKEYDPARAYSLKACCYGDLTVRFDDIDELLAYSKSHTMQIERLEMTYSVSSSRALSFYDDIEIRFQNNYRAQGFGPAIEVEYNFHDSESWLGLKASIESLLKVKQCAYWIFARIPMVFILLIFTELALASYVARNQIAFSEFESLIFLICCFAAGVASVSPFAQRTKSRLFPYCDFRFGLLEEDAHRASSFRALLGSGFVLAIIVSVIGNVLSGLLMAGLG